MKHLLKKLFSVKIEHKWIELGAYCDLFHYSGSQFIRKGVVSRRLGKLYVTNLDKFASVQARADVLVGYVPEA